MRFPSSPFADLLEIMNHRPLEICKPEVKTTVSARTMWNRNMLLPLLKPVLKNTTEQRSPVYSICQFGHVCSYLTDRLFSRCQLCIWNQLMIFHFHLSGLPLVKVVIKGWHFSLAYIVSGLIWKPYTQPFLLSLVYQHLIHLMACDTADLLKENWK